LADFLNESEDGELQIDKTFRTVKCRLTDKARLLILPSQLQAYYTKFDRLVKELKYIILSVAFFNAKTLVIHFCIS